MSGRVHLKICGTTSIEDARLVGVSGADYCGILVDVEFSERSLSLTEAAPVAAASGIANVILMCDPSLAEVEAAVYAIKPHAVQLLGYESPDFVQRLKSIVGCRIWKSVHLPPIAGQVGPAAYVEAGVDALLVDRADASDGFLRLGGTGKMADWGAAAELVRTVSCPVFLAGGITPGNVCRAVTEVRPHGIDLCSGVEAQKGKKDPAKVSALVREIKRAVSFA